MIVDSVLDCSSDSLVALKDIFDFNFKLLIRDKFKIQRAETVLNDL